MSVAECFSSCVWADIKQCFNVIDLCASNVCMLYLYIVYLNYCRSVNTYRPGKWVSEKGLGVDRWWVQMSWGAHTSKAKGVIIPLLFSAGWCFVFVLIELIKASRLNTDPSAGAVNLGVNTLEGDRWVLAEWKQQLIRSYLNQCSFLHSLPTHVWA